MQMLPVRRSSDPPRIAEIYSPSWAMIITRTTKLWIDSHLSSIIKTRIQMEEARLAVNNSQTTASTIKDLRLASSKLISIINLTLWMSQPYLPKRSSLPILMIDKTSSQHWTTQEIRANRTLTYRQAIKTRLHHPNITSNMSPIIVDIHRSSNSSTLCKPLQSHSPISHLSFHLQRSGQKPNMLYTKSPWLHSL